jgi:hypothetical protein
MIRIPPSPVYPSLPVDCDKKKRKENKTEKKKKRKKQKKRRGNQRVD